MISNLTQQRKSRTISEVKQSDLITLRVLMSDQRYIQIILKINWQMFWHSTFPIDEFTISCILYVGRKIVPKSYLLSPFYLKFLASLDFFYGFSLSYLILVTTATTGGGVPFSSRRTFFPQRTGKGLLSAKFIQRL